MQRSVYYSKHSGLYVVKDQAGKCYYFRSRAIANEMLKMVQNGLQIMGERELMRMMEMDNVSK